MTDISHSVTTIPGQDFSPAPLARVSPVHYPRNGAHSEEGTLEDDGQISCICGYFDDDGWTVACDKCNRWQHQLCYYPQYEDKSLPEDLQHYCVECKPREFDNQGARVRQRVRREEQESLINGMKRSAPKINRKKVKEPGYTNGWPLDKSRHERTSASPRDQQPPSKRPKTSHRPSDSLTNASTKGHSRKQTASNINHRRGASRTVGPPIKMYSDEFLKCYNEDEWVVTEANLYNSIAVTNTMSSWLQKTEEEFAEMHGGLLKHQVFNRWDGNVDNIPNKAQITITETQDGREELQNGYSPLWKLVTVESHVPTGSYIGELKGHVGFKDEYRDDPANRWSQLRHPEPFVFFHPKLPIYIDARNEGTLLRYVRKSCRPNAEIKILVTEGTDYHFCFMATQDLQPGMEVAVGWESAPGLSEILQPNGDGSGGTDLSPILPWVSTTLSNCGPCACQASDCLMKRFDHRGQMDAHGNWVKGYGPDAQADMMPKARKRRPGQQISPINTHLTSRSGSEALKGEPDDEPTDSSGSGERGSASRDITPYNYSHPGSRAATSEMSERERKKLEREEAIFRRQEEEKNGKPGKKKRNSGGSSLNTPSATSSKQLDGSSHYVNASTSRQSGLPSTKPGRRSKASSNQNSPPKTIIRTVKRPKPDYTDSATQCDMDREEAEKRTRESRPRKPFLSNTNRLLQRCALNNARRRGPAALEEVAKCLHLDDKMEVDRSSDADPPLPKREDDAAAVPQPEPTASNDTEMKDVDSATPPKVDDPTQEPDPSPSSPTVSAMAPPRPPWPSQVAHSAPETFPTHKQPDMHIQMPPPPAYLFSGASSPTLTADSTFTAESILTHSPATTAAPTPIFSPSVTAAVTPSPAKKKMSLSDYTKARKAKDKPSETKSEDREGSPASTASGPVMSGLNAAELAKATEGSAVVDDSDVRMEDASQSPEASKA